MGRHRAEDEGPRTLELGKLVAASQGAHGDPEPNWEDHPPRRWPLVVFGGSVALAAWLGWSLADLMTQEPARSSPFPTAVETVTADPFPAPTVTRWRTRTPSPAPTVTVFKTRTATPQEENDDQIPGIPDAGN